MEVADKYTEFKSSCLAILMNACLDTDDSVRIAVVESGGVAQCMGVLRMTEDQRASAAANSNYSILSRSAGLLSRLTGLASVQEKLKDPDCYQLLCSNLKRLGTRLQVGGTSNVSGSSDSLYSNSKHQKEQKQAQQSDEEIKKYDADEQSHLIRIIASLNPLPGDCCLRGMQEGVLESILAAFPAPRTELEKVTPTSVILPPHNSAPPLLIGNAARCLMPYADDPATAEILYCDKKLCAVEKLICSMATCSDIRIRRNISILLAKGCRVPGVRDRIEHLRGMQMIVELQNQL